jgi:hypothetical protein
MVDDDGVLDKLPRSRPGQRSAKRATQTSGEAAQRAEQSDAPAAKPAAHTTRPPKAQAPPPPPPEERPETSDPIRGALRAGAKVAGTGVRTLAGVAGYVLRRLPRP